MQSSWAPGTLCQVCTALGNVTSNCRCNQLHPPNLHMWASDMAHELLRHSVMSALHYCPMIGMGNTVCVQMFCVTAYVYVLFGGQQYAPSVMHCAAQRDTSSCRSAASAALCSCLWAGNIAQAQSYAVTGMDNTVCQVILHALLHLFCLSCQAALHSSWLHKKEWHM